MGARCFDISMSSKAVPRGREGGVGDRLGTPTKV
jgi:hypothetical protein